MLSHRIRHVPYVWRQQLGYVADFCPICREPRAFRLSSKRLIPQSYYIPVGIGEFVGNERRCLDCGVDLHGDPSRYAALARQGGSFGALKKLTYPGFDEAQRGRLELEKAVRKDPFGIDARDRQLLIRQPLELLSRRVEARVGAMQPDRDVAVTFVAAWVVAWAGMALAGRFVPESAEVVTLALLAMAVVAVAVQLALVNRRHMHRHVTPLLVRCLAPLKPGRDELEAAVADMKAARHRIGKALSVDHLMRRLDAARG